MCSQRNLQSAPDINQVGYHFDVAGIHATPCAAQMVRDHSCRNRTMLKFVEISMNQELRTTSTASPDTRIPVFYQISSPKPTTAVWLRFYSFSNTLRNPQEVHGTIPWAPVPPNPARPEPPRVGILAFLAKGGGPFFFALGAGAAILVGTAALAKAGAFLGGAFLEDFLAMAISSFRACETRLWASWRSCGDRTG